MGVSVGDIIDVGKRNQRGHRNACTAHTCSTRWVLQNLKKGEDAHDGHEGHEEQASLMVGIMLTLERVVRTVAYLNAFSFHKSSILKKIFRKGGEQKESPPKLNNLLTKQ